MFEKIGRNLVHRLKDCVAAKGVFSFKWHRTVFLRFYIVPLKDTAQKHVIKHLPDLTHHGTLHRHRRHHKHRQHVIKPCCFVTHFCTKNFALPQPQNGPRSPKNLENEPLGSFFFFLTTVPHMVENTVQK